MHTVILTGVSRGLGAALFDQLAGRGDTILAVGRSFTAAQRDLAATAPDRIRLHTADLAALEIPGEKELAELLQSCERAALIHNAAWIGPIGAVGSLPSDDLAAAVALNLTAPILLTNAFLAALPGTARASVLFISSGAAKRPVGGWGVYCGTKAGAEMFFNVLATQDERVTVENVQPGVMDTDMQITIRGAAASGGYFPDGQSFVDLHERGGLSDPAEVATKIIKSHLTSE